MSAPGSGSDVRESKLGAWVRLIVMTGVLVGLIQVCGLVAARVVPIAKGPRWVVVSRVTAIAVAEFVTVFLVMVWQRKRGQSLASLGFWRRSTFLVWVLAVALGLVTAFWGLSNPSLHLPSRLAAVFDISSWHVYSALVAGVTGGFCEELLYRGVAMRELAAVGYGAWGQASISALLFGFAHAGFLSLGIVQALMVAVPTAILGLLYAFLVLKGNRSLMPAMVSHFLNDVAVIPWIFFVFAAGLH